MKKVILSIAIMIGIAVAATAQDKTVSSNKQIWTRNIACSRRLCFGYRRRAVSEIPWQYEQQLCQHCRSFVRRLPR